MIKLFPGGRWRRRQIFRNTYRKGLWGSDGQSKFFSGIGSRGAAAQIYVERMSELLTAYAEQFQRSLTIVDLGCGDFQVGNALMARLPEFTYLGCDLLPELIAHNTENFATKRVRFRRLDIVSDPLPKGDVYLVRQVLQHLSNAEIMQVLEKLNEGLVYISEGQPVERVGSVNPDKTTGAEVRFDWRTGRGRGVELDQPPYCLGTEEVFRVSASPQEVIVTERIHLLPRLRQAEATVTRK